MAEQALDTSTVQLITFDCYGTLIDWESGIRDALRRQLEAGGLSWNDRYFDVYLHCEAEHQRRGYRPYKEILATAEADVLATAGLPAPTRPRLPSSLADWNPFPDTVEALERLRAKYKLGILSNIDRDLFLATGKHLQVAFDVIITAQDVRQYKPAPAHFTRLLQQTGLKVRQVLHVAQSLYHDIAPCNALGIPCAWINRRGETNSGSARPLAEFPDLASFASAVL